MNKTKSLPWRAYTSEAAKIVTTLITNQCDDLSQSSGDEVIRKTSMNPFEEGPLGSLSGL
jgi:hypothetical protein